MKAKRIRHMLWVAENFEPVVKAAKERARRERQNARRRAERAAKYEAATSISQAA